jgi:hypothetical protein
MPQRVTRVPEVYEHEAAFCHALAGRLPRAQRPRLLPQNLPNYSLEMIF